MTGYQRLTCNTPLILHLFQLKSPTGLILAWESVTSLLMRFTGSRVLDFPRATWPVALPLTPADLLWADGQFLGKG
jgi:hypothetical protein